MRGKNAARHFSSTFHRIKKATRSGVGTCERKTPFLALNEYVYFSMFTFFFFFFALIRRWSQGEEGVDVEK